MNRTTTQRGLAATALLGLLAAASACGTQTGVGTDPAVQPGLGQHPQGRAQQLGEQSDRALEADALRAAQGNSFGVTHPNLHRRLLAAKP